MTTKTTPATEGAGVVRGATPVAATLAQVMQTYPDLGERGFRCLDGEPDQPGLAADEPTVLLVAEWLTANIRPTTAIDARTSSYRLKHLAEDALGFYVANGVLIAAALMAGFQIERRNSGPNCVLNMRGADLEALRRDPPPTTPTPA